MERAGFGRDLGRVAGLWWVLAIVGALSLIAGVIIVAEPGISLATLAVIAGIFFLFDGIFEVGAALFGARENRGVIALVGVASAVAGVFLIRHPVGAVNAIAIVIGLWLIVVGVLRLVDSYGADERRRWGLLVGALEVIAGVVIVASPDIGVRTLALLVGISLIVRGVVLLGTAWLVGKVQRDARHRDRDASRTRRRRRPAPR
jgi:uncharacterized membrane protein HdeD (DUF308 family)